SGLEHDELSDPTNRIAIWTIVFAFTKPDHLIAQDVPKGLAVLARADVFDVSRLRTRGTHRANAALEQLLNDLGQSLVIAEPRCPPQTAKCAANELVVGPLDLIGKPVSGIGAGGRRVEA